MCPRRFLIPLIAGVTLLQLCDSAMGDPPGGQKLEHGAAPPAAVPADPPGTHGLQIRVLDPDSWKAEPEDVRRVLYWTARELWRYFPDGRLEPILVQARGVPIVLHQRGAQGEFQVRLNTGDTYWSQYAFQFAHEFCHILCKYDEDPHHNKWFEESICEVASLFAMRRMAESWEVDPPYPHWKNYSASLQTYADDRIAKAQLAEGMALGQWYRQHRLALRAAKLDRAKCHIVAVQLLPLFEASPEHWPAVSALNKEVLTEEDSFQDYLAAWHRNCPEPHRGFVRRLATEFGLQVGKAAAGPS